MIFHDEAFERFLWRQNQWIPSKQDKESKNGNDKARAKG